MTVRPRITGAGDRKEGRIKNRLNWFVVTGMKGRKEEEREGGGGGEDCVLTEVCRAFGTVIMSHISHALLFIADLAHKQKINNFEQI